MDSADGYRLSPACQVADDVAKILCDERLRERGFDVQPTRDVASSAASAQKYYGNLDVSEPAPKLVQEDLTVFDRQHQVDDHQLRKLHRTLCKGRLHICRRHDIVAIVSEHDLQHVTKGRVVIQNENRQLPGHASS